MGPKKPKKKIIQVEFSDAVDVMDDQLPSQPPQQQQHSPPNITQEDTVQQQAQPRTTKSQSIEKPEPANQLHTSNQQFSSKQIITQPPVSQTNPQSTFVKEETLDIQQSQFPTETEHHVQQEPTKRVFIKKKKVVQQKPQKKPLKKKKIIVGAEMFENFQPSLDVRIPSEQKKEELIPTQQLNAQKQELQKDNQPIIENRQEPISEKLSDAEQLQSAEQKREQYIQVRQQAIIKDSKDQTKQQIIPQQKQQQYIQLKNNQENKVIAIAQQQLKPEQVQNIIQAPQNYKLNQQKVEEKEEGITVQEDNDLNKKQKMVMQNLQQSQLEIDQKDYSEEMQKHEQQTISDSQIKIPTKNIKKKKQPVKKKVPTKKKIEFNIESVNVQNELDVVVENQPQPLETKQSDAVIKNQIKAEQVIENSTQSVEKQNMTQIEKQKDEIQNYNHRLEDIKQESPQIADSYNYKVQPLQQEKVEPKADVIQVPQEKKEQQVIINLQEKADLKKEQQPIENIVASIDLKPKNVTKTSKNTKVAPKKTVPSKKKNQLDIQTINIDQFSESVKEKIVDQITKQQQTKDIRPTQEYIQSTAISKEEPIKQLQKQQIHIPTPVQKEQNQILSQKKEEFSNKEESQKLQQNNLSQTTKTYTTQIPKAEGGSESIQKRQEPNADVEEIFFQKQIINVSVPSKKKKVTKTQTKQSKKGTKPKKSIINNIVSQPKVQNKQQVFAKQPFQTKQLQKKQSESIDEIHKQVPSTLSTFQTIQIQKQSKLRTEIPQPKTQKIIQNISIKQERNLNKSQQKRPMKENPKKDHPKISSNYNNSSALNALISKVNIQHIQEDSRIILRETTCMLKQDIRSRLTERPLKNIKYQADPTIDRYIQENISLKKQLSASNDIT